MMEGETGESVMFNKVNKEGLKVQTNRRNEVIKYLKSESITETNNFIRGASMWVAERIRLKKVEQKKKNEPRMKRMIEGV